MLHFSAKNALMSWLLAAVVLASGCCKKPEQQQQQQQEDEDGAQPGTAPPTPVAPPVTKPKPAAKTSNVPTAGEATINAPPFKNGAPRRGIVRSAANFQSSEVARLDNGTQLNLIRPPAGGWCEVSWPMGSDANRGFIHCSVLRVTLYGD